MQFCRNFFSTSGGLKISAATRAPLTWARSQAGSAEWSGPRSPKQEWTEPWSLSGRPQWVGALLSAVDTELCYLRLSAHPFTHFWPTGLIPFPSKKRRVFFPSANQRRPVEGCEESKQGGREQESSKEIWTLFRLASRRATSVFDDDTAQHSWINAARGRLACQKLYIFIQPANMFRFKIWIL